MRRRVGKDASRVVPTTTFCNIQTSSPDERFALTEGAASSPRLEGWPSDEPGPMVRDAQDALLTMKIEPHNAGSAVT
jgi:hypothetical protein